jgi:hypothetical protein
MFSVGRDVDPALFEPLIAELKKRPLTVNKYRTNSGEGRSQCFGIVKQRNNRYTGSRWNYERPELYAELLRIAAFVLPPDFTWVSCQINQNYQTEEHKDVGNKGLSAILGFGDYSGGGELVIEETPVSIKNRLVFFDGSIYTHSTRPWATGDRFSLVFHTPSRTFKSVPAYSLIPAVEKGKEILILREELEGLVRLWKRGRKCIHSSDGVLPEIVSRKASLLECIEE